MRERTKKSIVKAFLVALVLGIGALFTTSIILNNTTARAAMEYSVRETLDFNAGWKFSKGQGFEDRYSSSAITSSPNQGTASVTIPNSVAVWNTDFFTNEETYGTYNDNWQDVSLPHTWNDIDTFESFNEGTAATYTMNGDRTMYTGTGWYKKSFYLPHTYSDKQIVVEFEAARQAAQVWVNGQALDGKYLNGNIAFGYDITSANLDFGTAGGGAWNEITVLVDNSFPYYVTVNNNDTTNTTEDDYFETMYDAGITTATTGLPWHDSHWQPNYGGLYRNANLYIMNKLQLTLPLYSFTEGEGTYIYTTNEDGTNETAVIHVDAQVANLTGASQSFDVYADVYDMNGNKVLSLSTVTADAEENPIYNNITLASGKQTVQLSGTLSQVIRWDASYPYLYTVKTYIGQTVEGVTTVTDNNEDQLGIRTYQFTTDKGFYLNGNAIDIVGWGQKSTNEWAGIGAAYSDWMTDYTFSLMKEANANYVRFGHCAGGPTQIDACEKYGIMVTQPGVDGEGYYTTNPCAGGYTTTSAAVRTNAFRDMIIYYRNSPAIIAWEVGNKDIYSDTTKNNTFYDNLKVIIGQYDYGNRNADGDSDSDTNDISNTGLKVKDTTAPEKVVARDTSERVITSRESIWGGREVYETTQGNNGFSTTVPCIEGEQNRYETRRGALDSYTEGYQNFKNTVPSNLGQNIYKDIDSEEFAVQTVTTYYDYIANKGTSMQGGANWIFSDSISHARVVSEVSRTSGEVDATFLEKEGYYVSKILYGKDINSYIIGHWDYPAGTVKKVYAVSKANSLKLVVTAEDGSTTEYIGTNSKGWLFTFNNVAWVKGSVSVIGYNSTNCTGIPVDTAAYTKHSTGVATSVKLTKVGSVTPVANGADYVLFDVEAVDANGNRCPTFTGITYDSEGNLVFNDSGKVVFTLNESAGTSTWIGGYNSAIANSTFKKYLYMEAGIMRIAVRTTNTAGDITVTAAINGLNPASVTVASTAYTPAGTVDSKAYGYSATPRARLIYSLDGLAEINYNEIEYSETSGDTEYSTKYIADLSINGANIGLSFAHFVNGETIYFDRPVAWADVPTDLESGRYIQLENANYSFGASQDFLSFKSKRTADMLLLVNAQTETLPIVTKNGAQITLTDSGMITVSTTGIMYRVFYTNIAENDNLVFKGANDPNGTMYVIGFLDTINTDPVLLDHKTYDSNSTRASAISDFTKYGYVIGGNGGTFYHQQFPYTDANSVRAIDVDIETIDGKTGLRVFDYSSSNTLATASVNGAAVVAGYGYLTTSFATQTTDFFCDFDLYIKKVVGTSAADRQIGNRYLRFFLQQGEDFDYLGANAGAKLYFDNYNTGSSAIADSLKICYRTKASDAGADDQWLVYNQTVPTANGQTATDGVGTDIAHGGRYVADAWYRYRIAVDMANKCYDLFISEDDGVTWALLTASSIPFTKSTLTSLDHFVIATGNNASNDFVVSNIEIKKATREIVSDISIAKSSADTSTTLPYFYEDTHEYYVGDLTDEEFAYAAEHTAVTLYANAATDGYTHTVEAFPIRKLIKVTVSQIVDSVSTISDVYYIYCDKNAVYKRYDGKFIYNFFSTMTTGTSPALETVDYRNKLYLDSEVYYSEITGQYADADMVTQYSTFKTNALIGNNVHFTAPEDITAILMINYNRRISYDWFTINGWTRTTTGGAIDSEGNLYLAYEKVFSAGEYSIQYGNDSFGGQVSLLMFKSVAALTNDKVYNHATRTYGEESNVAVGWDYNYLQYSLNKPIDQALMSCVLVNKDPTNGTTDLDSFKVVDNTVNNGILFNTNFFKQEKELVATVDFFLTANSGARIIIGREHKPTELPNSITGALAVIYIKGTALYVNSFETAVATAAVPNGRWFKLVTYIDIEARKYDVRLTELDGTIIYQYSTDKGQKANLYVPSSPPANYEQVTYANSISIGTLTTMTSEFYVKKLEVSTVEHNVVSDIKIKDESRFTNFDECLHLYAYVLGTDNQLFTASDIDIISPEGKAEPTLTLTESEDHKYVTITVSYVSQNDGVSRTNKYKVYILGDYTPIRNVLTENTTGETALIASEYTPESWANYAITAANAKDLIDNGNYNYYDINTSVASLASAKAALVLQTYTATSNVATNGTVSTDVSSNIDNGTTVNITVTPDAGYELDTLTVTDAEGNIITTTGSGTAYSFTMPANNVTVDATFKLISYSVTFDSGFEDVEDPAVINDKNVTNVISLPTLTKDGYTFNGWKVQGGDETVYTTSYIMPASDVVLIADWSEATYDVTLEYNDGEATRTSSYTYGTGLTLPVATEMTRNGYIFLGWTATSEAADTTYITTISTTDFGNKTFYAKWAEKAYVYSVTYVGTTYKVIAQTKTAGVTYELTLEANDVDAVMHAIEADRTTETVVELETTYSYAECSIYFGSDLNGDGDYADEGEALPLGEYWDEKDDMSYGRLLQFYQGVYHIYGAATTTNSTVIHVSSADKFASTATVYIDMIATNTVSYSEVIAVNDAIVHIIGGRYTTPTQTAMFISGEYSKVYLTGAPVFTSSSIDIVLFDGDGDSQLFGSYTDGTTTYYTGGVLDVMYISSVDEFTNDYSYAVGDIVIEGIDTNNKDKFALAILAADENYAPNGYNANGALVTSYDSETSSLKIAYKMCPLIINYYYAGTTDIVAPQHVGSVAYNSTYSVDSIAIDDYTPDLSVVAGTMDNVEGKTITVYYTRTGYTVTFMANDNVTTYATKNAVADTALGTNMPEALTKDGFYFMGWNTVAGQTTANFDSTTVVSANTTVYPAYKTIINMTGASFTTSPAEYSTEEIYWTESDLTGTVPTGATLTFSVSHTDIGTYNDNATLTANDGYIFADGTTSKTVSVTTQITAIEASIETNPTFGSVYVGQYLSDVTLTGGVGIVAGTFSWKNGTTRLTSTTNTATLIFTPEGTNYTATEVEVTVNATQIALTIPEGITVTGTETTTVTGNVLYGETLTFTVDTLANGYEIDTFTIDGTPATTGATKVVNAPITIVFTTKAIDYTITFENGTGYTISATKGGEPFTSESTITIEDTVIFTITADTGYTAGTLTASGTNRTFTDNTLSGVYENVTVSGSAELTNYTVTFVSGFDDVTAPDTLENKHYNDVISLPTLSKAGYTFNGWKVQGGDETVYTETYTLGTTNVTFVGDWTIITYTIGYTLNDGIASGTNPESYTVVSDEITLSNPTKTGYTFEGWTGTDLEEATTTIKISTGSIGNRTYTATWAPIKYTLTINYYQVGTTTDLATQYTSQVDYNSEYSVESPEVVGYTTETLTVTGTMDSVSGKEINVYYTINTHKVTFYDEDGSLLAETTVNYNESAEYPRNTPIKDEDNGYTYTFDNWYTAQTEGSIDNLGNVVANRNVYARYTATAKTFTITFTSGLGYTITAIKNGTDTFGSGSSITIEDSIAFTITADTGYTAGTLTAVGVEGKFTFVGNTLSGVYTDVEITGSATLNSYRLTINYYYKDTINVIATQYVEDVSYGDTYNVTSPEVTGYTPDFATTSGTMGIADITEVVYYTIKQYTITFHDEYGGVLGTDTVDYNTTAEYPAAEPSKSQDNGYTYAFAGWYTATTEGEIDNLQNVTADRNVYARFTATPRTYNVTYVENGGTDIENTTYIYGIGLANLPTADDITKTGHTFDGWYTSYTPAENDIPEMWEGHKGSVTTEDYGDITLYAKWNVATYNVTLNYNNGETAIVDNYTYGEEYTLPTTYFRDGYVLLGWTLTNDAEDTTYITTIPVGSTGNKEYFAKWAEKGYIYRVSKVDGSYVVTGETTTTGITYSLTPYTNSIDAVMNAIENDRVSNAGLNPTYANCPIYFGSDSNMDSDYTDAGEVLVLSAEETINLTFGTYKIFGAVSAGDASVFNIYSGESEPTNVYLNVIASNTSEASATLDISGGAKVFITGGSYTTTGLNVIMMSSADTKVYILGEPTFANGGVDIVLMDGDGNCSVYGSYSDGKDTIYYTGETLSILYIVSIVEETGEFIYNVGNTVVNGIDDNNKDKFSLAIVGTIEGFLEDGYNKNGTMVLAYDSASSSLKIANKEYTVTFENGTGYTISATKGGEPFTSESTITIEDTVIFTITADTGYTAGTLTASGTNRTFTDNTLSGVYENVTVSGSAELTNYTVTFKGNDNTTTYTTKNADYNTTLSGNMPAGLTATGKYFIGWNTVSGQTTANFDATTAITADVTVYPAYKTIVDLTDLSLSYTTNWAGQTIRLSQVTIAGLPQHTSIVTDIQYTGVATRSENVTLQVEDGYIFADGTISKTVTVAVTISPAINTGVVANGYSHYYDGQGHSISVMCADSIIYYSTDTTVEKTWSPNNPVFTEVTNTIVYYKVVKTNYMDYIGAASVVITPATATVMLSKDAYGYEYGSAVDTVSATTTPSGLVVTYLYTGTGYSHANAPTAIGEYTVTASVSGNYTGSDTASYVISAGTIVGVEATGAYSGIYTGDTRKVVVTATTSDVTIEYSLTNLAGSWTTTPFEFTTPTNGAKTIYYRVTKDNYTTVTGSAIINIIKLVFENVVANGFSGEYDGLPHGISVSTTTEGATIEYSTDSSATKVWSRTNPEYIDAMSSASTVYYRITKENYTTVTGSKTVLVTKATVITEEVVFNDVDDSGVPSVTVPEGVEVEIVYEERQKDGSYVILGAKPTLAGEYRVTVTYTGDENHANAVLVKDFEIDDEKPEGLPIWIWIAIAGGAVLLIGTIVIVVAVKKKKSKLTRIEL